MTQNNLPTGVTEGKIKEWKEKHKQVKMITCKSENGDVVYIIGRPTRDILDALSKYYNDGNNVKAREVLEKNCVLHGDVSKFAEDVNLANTVHKKITAMLEDVQAEEKEL